VAKFFFTDTAVMELIVQEGNASGGAAVQTLMWMEGLTELGHKVFLAKLENDNRPIKPAFKKFQLVPIYDSSKGIRVIRMATYRIPAFYKALKKTCPDFLYDSVPWWDTYINVGICKLLNIKHIIRISSDIMLDSNFKKTTSRSHKFFMHIGLRNSSLILAQNNYQFQSLKKLFPKTSIQKIYNPIIINKDFLHKKEDFMEYIAWIANFRFAKNLKLLYIIAKAMPHENFKIAGIPFNPLDNESKEYVDLLRKLNNVMFMGKLNREDIPPFLAKSKFLLNTSRYEGFSNTFLEAMCTGTPILTGSLVNPDGIIDRNDLGFVYHDELELQKFLNNISLERYQQLSENCIEYVCQNHEYIALSHRLLELLNDNKSLK
jgi:glycosyltransferase involved in cell wall biosynthesis